MCMEIARWHLDAKAKGIGYKILTEFGESPIWSATGWPTGVWIEATLGSVASMRDFGGRWGDILDSQRVQICDKDDPFHRTAWGGAFSPKVADPQGIYVIPNLDDAISYMATGYSHYRGCRVAAIEWNTLLATGEQDGFELITVQFAKFLGWIQRP